MLILCTLPLWAGCKGLIDDNLDNCAAEVAITYELRLVTNVQTEMATELDQPEDVFVRQALESYLEPVFTDFAHDLDLSFYDVMGENPLLHHKSEIMDASQTSYTLHLPAQDYMHNAVANIQGNAVAALQNTGFGHQASLEQMNTKAASDSVATHKTGLFVGRLKDMDIKAGVKNQTFKVTLNMANSATALVVDTTGSKIKKLKVYSTGFATAFRLADSIFNYPVNFPIVKDDELDVAGGVKRCFAAVNFPSKDTPGSKVIIETTDPFVSIGSTEGLWAWHCYATLPDGTVTRTLLSVKTPLRAGQLEIIKARLWDDGVVRTDVPTVGVSVTLDWKPGGSYDPIL